MNDTERLLNLKESISNIEHESAKNKAMLEILMNDLNRMGYKTYDEAEEYLKNLDIEFNKIQIVYEKKLRELEEKYGKSTII